MNNTFVEAHDDCGNLKTETLKKKIILFSLLAAAVSCVIETLLSPMISEILSDNTNTYPFTMVGVKAFISFFASIVRFAFLVWGGYSITRCKEGAVRFAGIFMLSAAISNSLTGMFDFIENMPLGDTAVSCVLSALNVVAAFVGAVISIKLFSIFECRTENQYVTGKEFSFFRKKMMILIVLAYVLVFASSGISGALVVATSYTADSSQMFTYAISIFLSVIDILILLIVYLLAKKVRGIKSDVIGFGGAYYFGGFLNTTVTLLVTGFSVSLIDASGNNALYMLSSVISVVVNLITIIVSVIIMFKVLKLFFPVKDEPVNAPEEDRAERILKNLIASGQNTENEN